MPLLALHHFLPRPQALHGHLCLTTSPCNIVPSVISSRLLFPRSLPQGSLEVLPQTTILVFFQTSVKVQGWILCSGKKNQPMSPASNFFWGGNTVILSQGNGGILPLPQLSSTPWCSVGWEGGSSPPAALSSESQN